MKLPQSRTLFALSSFSLLFGLVYFKSISSTEIDLFGDLLHVVGSLSLLFGIVQLLAEKRIEKQRHFQQAVREQVKQELRKPQT